MKKILLLVIMLAVSVTSGYLMSESTWIGKVGISLFHKEYNLTKVWWQGGLVVFAVLCLLYLILSLCDRSIRPAFARILYFLFFAIGVAGLYFTWEDFQDDFSHRMLGHHFHAGFYLAWAGWIVVCLFFVLKRNRKKESSQV